MNLSFSEYKAIVEWSPNMIWRAGTDGKCNYFNETWLKFTGRTMEQEYGDGWVEGVHVDDTEFCFQTYLRAFKKREAFEMEYRLKRHDGQWRWINDRGVPFFGENGSFEGYIGSCVDVTERVEGQKLTHLAHNDILTGLFNRNYIDYLFGYEYTRAKKELRSDVIIMMDIDKFKFFNDEYGHGFGDKVLKLVASKISENIRKTDIAGRYGGDEFLMILPATTVVLAEIIGQRILDSLAFLMVDNIPAKISLSMGMISNQNDYTMSELMEKADKAMYHAKRNGGNRIVEYADD